MDIFWNYTLCMKWLVLWIDRQVQVHQHVGKLAVWVATAVLPKWSAKELKHYTQSVSQIILRGFIQQ